MPTFQQRIVAVHSFCSVRLFHFRGLDVSRIVATIQRLTANTEESKAQLEDYKNKYEELLRQHSELKGQRSDVRTRNAMTTVRATASESASALLSRERKIMGFQRSLR